ncbi:MAG: GntR family transcriptional regulator [Hungatella sp.]|nr:GntR family transcriptional regulator [Hungatella sp.]
MFKYEVIANDIQSKILSGFYKPDEKLPQEFELCKQYNASRITIREAMELLVHNGLITKRRGAGTFVKAISGGSDNHEGFAKSQQFGGFSKDKEGHNITSVIHQFEPLRSPAEIAEKLQIAEGSFICYICRSRLVDGKPHVTEYTYMPTDLITGITDDVVHGSIYSYIENTLKLKIQSAHRIVRASMPTDQERQWLDIGYQPLPILEVEQVAYLADGRIFEYSKSRHRADCFEIRTVSVQ